MLLARLALVALLTLGLGPASVQPAEAALGSVAISITPLGLDQPTVVAETPHVGWINRDSVAHTVTFETIACTFTLAPGESTLSPAGVPVKGCTFTSPRGPAFNFLVGRYLYRVDGFAEPVFGRLAVIPVTVPPVPQAPQGEPKPRPAPKPSGRGPAKPKKKHCHTRSRR